MQTKQNDMSSQEARNALSWLIEMGADEIVGEEPVNRFAAAPLPVAVVEEAVAAPAPSNPASCVTLMDLKAALLQLDCPLKKTASNLCFMGGNLEAPIMVIGDVPGRDEDIEGKVFAGQNGLLLERMLGAIGLSFDTVSLFNFIPWRPPGNRTVTESEIQMCQPFLLRAIELCRPKFVLCLGMHPAQRLSGRNEGLMALRGKWFELAVGFEKIPVLASFHPSYLNLQAAQKRLAWRDLLAFKEKLDAH
jgi:uracil-DNA glycosylase